MLRDGAVLAVLVAAPLKESPEKKFTLLRPTWPSEKELAAGRATVTESLSPVPVSVDEIIRQCQLTPATVLAVLLELALAGRAERHPGNQFSLIPDAEIVN